MKYKRHYTSFLFYGLPLFMLGFLGCSNNGDKKDTSSPLMTKNAFTLPYQLNSPSETFKLPKKLQEISGVSFINDQELACIQDEKAIIYVFDLEEKSITRKIDFGKNNDKRNSTFT